MSNTLLTVRLHLSRLALSLLLVLAAAGSAAAQSSMAAEQPPQYRVEMVVFTQPSLGIGDEERPFERSQSLTRPMAWPLREADRPGFGYEQLDPATHQLARAAQRLAAEPGFTVHWHAAWVQPGVGRFQSQAVALPRALRDAGLEGWVRVYRERFLHAETGLRLREDGELLASFYGSRRMRSAEQHYLDNPLIGVLVRVDPWEPESAP